MTEHFTRNTVSAQFYCGKCRRMTAHRIDDRRKGPCLECIAKLEAQHALQGNEPKKVAAEKQGELFHA